MCLAGITPNFTVQPENDMQHLKAFGLYSTHPISALFVCWGFFLAPSRWQQHGKQANQALTETQLADPIIDVSQVLPVWGLRQVWRQEKSRTPYLTLILLVSVHRPWPCKLNWSNLRLNQSASCKQGSKSAFVVCHQQYVLTNTYCTVSIEAKYWVS